MKYLVYIGPGIGDWVIALPMARRIKLNDSDAFITALIKGGKEKIKTHQMLLSMQKWIDEVEYYSLGEPIHDVKLLIKLGLKKYDYYFKTSYLDNPYISKWPNRIMKLVSKKGVGVRLSSKPEFKYEYEIPFDPSENVYIVFLRLLELINIKYYKDEDKYSLFDISEDWEKSSELVELSEEKVIAIVPGTAPAPVTADGKNGYKQAKNWPYKYWNELATKLTREGFTVVVLGGNAENIDISDGHYFAGDRMVNMCGKTTIKESCAILKRSLLVVGGDTGMVHCAGAVGTPSLTLYGCTSYKNYLPYGKNAYYITAEKDCSPCFGSNKLKECNDFLCMNEISVEDVYKKIHMILSENNNTVNCIKR